MKRTLLEMLICPSCLPEEHRFREKVLKSYREDLLEGSLQCEQCSAEYRIQEGIAFLNPNHSEQSDASNRYETIPVLSSYLWSHFGDLLDDKEATDAYRKWIEFIVADALALPFRSETFSAVASLNVVDKVPKPIVHIAEINRSAGKHDAQFLFSDPFSWSTAAAREEDWLGGTSIGSFAGRGKDNIMALLEGRKGDIYPPWKVKDHGHVWWKIRTHSNHFELIRSFFIKAVH
jgi:uncharacterized protein YbaR (Trm112 family)